MAIGICRSFRTPMADLFTNNLLSSMFTDREKTVQRSWYTIGQITLAYFSATVVDVTAAHLRDRCISVKQPLFRPDQMNGSSCHNKGAHDNIVCA